MLSGKIDRYLVLYSDQPPFPSTVCDLGFVIPLTSPQEPSLEYETYLVRLCMPLTSVTPNTTLNSNSISDLLPPFSFQLLLCFVPKTLAMGHQLVVNIFPSIPFLFRECFLHQMGQESGPHQQSSPWSCPRSFLPLQFSQEKPIIPSWSVFQDKSWHSLNLYPHNILVLTHMIKTLFCLSNLIPVSVCVCVCVCMCYSLSCFVTPRAIAHQAPLSMGILQARTLEWVAIPFSRGSSNPAIEPGSPAL